MPQEKVVKNKSYQAGLVEYSGSRLSSMLQAKIVRKQILSTFLPAAWAFFRKQAKLFWGSLQRILWRQNCTLYFFFGIFDWFWYLKLSRCASCVARCILPCDLCAYFRNLQGQTISSWILVYLSVCPTFSKALKVFGPKKY